MGFFNSNRATNTIYGAGRVSGMAYERGKYYTNKILSSSIAKMPAVHWGAAGLGALAGGAYLWNSASQHSILGNAYTGFETIGGAGTGALAGRMLGGGRGMAIGAGIGALTGFASSRFTENHPWLTAGALGGALGAGAFLGTPTGAKMAANWIGKGGSTPLGETAIGKGIGLFSRAFRFGRLR